MFARHAWGPGFDASVGERHMWSWTECSGRGRTSDWEWVCVGVHHCAPGLCWLAFPPCFLPLCLPLEAAEQPCLVLLLEVCDGLLTLKSPSVLYKYFGSISSLKKKKPLRRDASWQIKESMRSWSRFLLFCFFSFSDSTKWEYIQTGMRTALLYFWKNKRNLAVSCKASDIHIFFWLRHFAKCQCYSQSMAVFILICKYHSCELWSFPALGIRVGIREVVKVDPGKGTTFWKMQT